MGTRVTAPTFVDGVLYTPDGPDVPDDVLDRIGAHLLPEAEPVADDEGEKGDGGEQTGGEGEKVERPNGRHGVETWLRYAGAQGIDVPDSAVDDKAQIIALVEQHEAAAAAAEGDGTPQGDPGAGNGQDA